MDEFVSTHQDKSRNALIKAHEAGFLAWSEELKADQAQFMSEKLSILSNNAFLFDPSVQIRTPCHSLFEPPRTSLNEDGKGGGEEADQTCCPVGGQRSCQRSVWGMCLGSIPNSFKCSMLSANDYL